jgi:hypothetical protein
MVAIKPILVIRIGRIQRRGQLFFDLMLRGTVVLLFRAN